MKATLHKSLRDLRRLMLTSMIVMCMAAPILSATDSSELLLQRTSARVGSFLDLFSDVKCTEHVVQEKLDKNGKVETRAESSYDYLVILTNTGGELSLNESRLPVLEVKAQQKKPTSLLVSNGFATLFLVFHPYYAGSFRFATLEDDAVGDRRVSKIHFEHIPGTKSPAALALRGREYPLELSGDAWIDPQTGVIEKLVGGVSAGMEDVGLKVLHSEIQFAPVPFKGMTETYWFPVEASVEVETPRQRWHNVHRFTDYKRFSVSTEEQVANK